MQFYLSLTSFDDETNLQKENEKKKIKNKIKKIK